MSENEIYQVWRKHLPEILYRCEWDKYKRYGVPYTRDYMAQLDAKGVGPQKNNIGGKTYYHLRDLINWHKHRRKMVKHPSI